MTVLADVAVIGGGPAGSAAARLLASWGQSVIVLAREPRQPPLAESLPPSCVKLFDEIGVREAMDRAGFIRATGNTVQWGGADRARRVEMFDRAGLGYQVARDKFDEILLDSAQVAGASVERDVVVRDAVREHDVWRVEFNRTGAADTVRARWLLTRLMACCRRGWRRTDSGARRVAGIWDREGRDAWPLDDATHTLVEAGERMGVGVQYRHRAVPYGDARSTRDSLRPRGLTPRPPGGIAVTPGLRALVNGADVGAPWACDATPYSSTRVGGEGALLVGDAASFVDPLSSFGVKKALASAWLAAVVAHTALVDPAATDGALELFTAREFPIADHLRRGAAALARDAAGVHETSFWSARADAGPPLPSDDWDIDALRADGRVQTAFEEVRRFPLPLAGSILSSSAPVVCGIASPRGARGGKFERCSGCKQTPDPGHPARNSGILTASKQSVPRAGAAAGLSRRARRSSVSERLHLRSHRA
jgi:hypothetical protein